MRAFGLVVLVALSGCSKHHSKPSLILDSNGPTTWTINGKTIVDVDCKDGSQQFKIHLADRTLVTDCNAVVDGVDLLMHPKPTINQTTSGSCSSNIVGSGGSVSISCK